MDWAKQSLDKLAASRARRLKQTLPLPGDAEQDALLKAYHPDYLGKERTVCVGANAGSQKFPPELAQLLESDSPLPQGHEPKVELKTDVLILGGGGAGVSAALALQGSGLAVALATKLRLGDSNTVMAEGGIQASLGSGDSPRRHFADSYVGGHGNNDVNLLRILCESATGSVDWLSSLGCLFDRNDDGTYRLRAGGGTSVPRVLACRDYTGLEIMRVLKDALLATETRLLEDHAAVELTDDGDGAVTGAVLWNRGNGTLTTVSARAVILATGGSGQLRLQGFPTSNHLGATGDGLILAYRQGCELRHADSFQYHPSGAAYPEALAGQLVTEAIRSAGAQVVNAEGEAYIDALVTRDVLAAATLKEVAEGRGVQTPAGRKGVWLDTPLIEVQKGEGTLRRQFPSIIHRFERYGIDPAQQPILVHPTLHYQNGGIRTDADGLTQVPGLWAAGEVTGGLHGTNRLMGNSLLDITVFGRRAAQSVRNHLPERGAVTLTALANFRKQRADAEGLSGDTAPLFFPVVSGMKFSLAESASAAEEASPPESQTASSFEPPDPFAR